MNATGMLYRVVEVHWFDIISWLVGRVILSKSSLQQCSELLSGHWGTQHCMWLPWKI